MKYGFIGLGNMATAILRGMKLSGLYRNDKFYGYDITDKQALADEISMELVTSEVEVVTSSDVIVLAVKPQMMLCVMEKIKDHVSPSQLIVTIAAGKPLSFYEDKLTSNPVVRVMPNINAKVGCAISAVCGGKNAQTSHIEIVKGIFTTVGTVCEISEEKFPAFSALGGASGSFVLLLIDAVASAGVKAGLPRALSETIATQVVKGSAVLKEKSDDHPCALIDQICSPGGTTIEGVHALKKYGFETAIHEGIQAIIEKDKKLGE